MGDIEMVMKAGTEVITFRVQHDLKVRIENAAIKQDRSVNNFLTHMVNEYLDTIEAKGLKATEDASV